MYGTFLFNLASPVVAFVAKLVASSLLIVLGLGLCAGGLVVQVCAPVIAFWVVFSMTSCCCDEQHCAARYTCYLLCGLAALGAALGVYFVADILFSLVAKLGFYLADVGFCFYSYPCNHA
jgi:hypothetical protein